ncbi:MAG: Acyl-CoA dehydrogenase, partial [Ilumatobacteraceae bacterium]|nr:Acyl-CoA dehydrogenase [Ilumatobacteraceae bacterium]
EPQGGSDPSLFKTTAVQYGDEWVINGEKWFTSAGRVADILFVMCTNGMFVVPRNTPGVEIMPEPRNHNHIVYTDVRVPLDHLLGPPNGAKVLAQRRLGGGRIHHAMRTVGMVQRAFDMMCERALSRSTQGELLGRKQLVQGMIADSWIEMESFRLLVMRTAWRIDKYKDYKRVRKDISAVKAAMPRVFHDVAARALQIHGSLGVSNEMPFSHMLIESFHMGLADGPTEVHKITVARQVLSEYTPTSGMFPTMHTPALREAAIARYADVIERHVAEL